MDLGIRGKRAIVCAASRGLGRGCAEALAAAGVDLVICARGREALEETASAIAAAHGVRVIPVVADITTEAGRAEVLSTARIVDILVTNAGGPAPGMWYDWTRDDFLRAINANMLSAVAMMQACLPEMMGREWGRVVNITSSAVRAPIGTLGLSNAARAGLTGFVAGTARQVASMGVTINNLLPGTHATDRATTLDRRAAEERGMTEEAVRAEHSAAIPAGRYGTTQEFGALCAFLCSAHAGFIVGQNILVDGGAVNLTL